MIEGGVFVDILSPKKITNNVLYFKRGRLIDIDTSKMRNLIDKNSCFIYLDPPV